MSKQVAPLFQAIPPSITFQNYEPLETYTAKLVLRNNDKSLRRVKIEAPDHPSFSVIPVKKPIGTGKIAAGMDVAYTVTFTPSEKRDYEYNLICVTEQEKFIIPIRALGARAALDFPSEISFPRSPVKHKSSITLLIHNFGECATTFTAVVAEPFAVSPATYYLDVHDSVQVVVSFLPVQLGVYEGGMTVTYDTGEQMTVILRADVVDVNVQLERPLLKMVPTFIDTVSQKTIKIFNRSDIVSHFEWKQNPEGREEYDSEGVFIVDPMVGDIWPNADLDVTVKFNPQTALDYVSDLYLDMVGREQRMPLRLQGEGIGPRIRFNYDKLEVGGPFVNSVQHYELMMENVGHIDAPFQLQPPNTTFKVTPNAGIIRPGERMQLQVIFEPDFCGDFEEVFKWDLQGSPEPATFRIRGSVQTPTFYFDLEQLDFGAVSYGFLHTKMITLSNESEVPIRYFIKVPDDGTFQSREFDVSPPSNLIPPHSKQKIQVDLIPRFTKRYSTNVVLAVEHVGDECIVLPLAAECGVPDVKLSTKEANFGTVFLRHPTEYQVMLINESDLPASYEMVPQDETSTTIATYYADNPKGTIAARSEQAVNITIEAESLGTISIPAFFTIVGAQYPALAVELVAQAVGPTVKFAKDVLDFGKVPVLIPQQLRLGLVNTSVIAAEFRVFTKTKNSVFTVEPREGVLQPHETIQLVVTAHLNEVMRFKDTLTALITDGEVTNCLMSALGLGTALFCADDISTIDFGDQWTNQECIREFTLENKGRKTQALQWSVPKKDLEAMKEPVVFDIVPERVTLPPMTAQVFVLRGYTVKPQDAVEVFTCRATEGRNSKPIYEVNVRASFSNPLLQFSRPSMSFVYTWAPENPPTLMSQKLTMRNVSKLPLNFTLRCPAPFVIDGRQFSLQPDESADVTISFDPAYRKDRQSHKIRPKMQITYKDHPQKDGYEISAEVNYPNLSFDRTDIDFGCVLNESQKRVMIAAKNTSTVPVEYRWVFSSDNDARVFDVLPIHNVLQPGQPADPCEFVFFGQSDSKQEARAICEVAGGPEYEFTLHGEASSVAYEFDTTVLDCGLQLYDKAVEKEFILYNTGKVSFPFVVSLDGLKHPGTLSVSPVSGNVNAAERQRFVVRFVPGVAERVEENFTVKVGPFAPRVLTIGATGIFPQVHLNLDKDTAQTASVLPRATLASLSVSTTRSRAAPTARPVIDAFVCDFGNVVIGQSRKRTFRLVNTGHHPVSYELDKRTLSNNGYVVEPDRVSKLPAQPADETARALEIAVMFQSKPNDALGARTLDVPFNLHDGPSYVLRLRVNVTMPEVALSSDKLDFGELLTGRCKTMTVQLHNPKEVPCEWSVQKQQGSAAKDAKFFKISPEGGSLPPDGRVNVDVTFTPTERRPYTTRIPIKLANNPQKYHVTCKAAGAELVVSFQPPVIEHKPILPHSKGTVAELNVVNDTDYPVELISLDFDTQFADEDAARLAGPPMVAITELPPVATVTSVDDAAAALAAAAGAPTDAPRPTTAAAADARPGTATTAGGDRPTTATDGSRPVLAPGLSYVLYGPRSGGVSTLAKRLHERNRFTILSLDEVFEEKEAAIPLAPEQAVEILLAKLQLPECAGPIVIDGLWNKYIATPEAAAAVIRQAFDKATRKVAVIVVNTSADALRARAAKVLDEERQARFVPAVPHLTEDEYDQLSPEEQAKYDADSKAYRRWQAQEAALNKAAEQEAIDKQKRAEAYAAWEAAQASAPVAKPGAKKTEPPPEPAFIDDQHRDHKQFSKYVDAVVQAFALAPPEGVKGAKPGAKAPAKPPAKGAKPADEPVAEPPYTTQLKIDGSGSPEDLVSATVELLPPAREPTPPPAEPVEHILEVTEPRVWEIVKRPPTRATRPTLVHTSFTDAEHEAPPKEPPKEVAAPVKPPAKGAKAAAVEPPPEPEKPLPPVATRWTIPPKSTVPIMVKFVSQEIGAFTETLLFEIRGTDKQYTITSKGVCAFPQISDDPRNVFMRKVKAKPSTGYVHRQYVAKDNVFDFGPLLMKKERKEYKQCPHPDNVERFRITNNGLYPCHIDFMFKSDASQTTFLLDPPAMDLERDQTADLLVWAYPETAGEFKDAVICCVKDNPVPAVFDIVCVGATPQVQLEKADIKFDRLLLGRSDSQTVALTNMCPLPVNWALVGDDLGEALTVFPTSGTLQPAQVATIQVDFAARTAGVIKKALRIEVKDAQGIVPKPVQTVPVSIVAEAYDINVELNFTKGDQSGMDFGLVKVFQEMTQAITLKNKGQYPVAFKIAFTKKRYADLFTITPESGTLNLADKTPTTVNIAFRSDREVTLAAIPDLQCQLSEPTSGEVLARLPLKVSARSVFSQYKIVPLHGVNFGPIEHGNTVKRMFEITNLGEFEFRYTLFKYADGPPAAAPVEAAVPAGQKPKPAAKPAAAAAAGGPLKMDQFTITPSSATVAPGAMAVVTVDFVADGARACREVLGIDVGGRNPSEDPQGVAFELAAESCIPGIITTDYDSIFEEQRVAQTLDVHDASQQNVFAVNDRAFSYGAIVANQQQVQERFKIINASKVDCDVELSLKPLSVKGVPQAFAFELQPATMHIPASEYSYVTVSFKPTAMATYAGTFTATVAKGTDAKTKTLSFEVRGEGTLPQAQVVEPSARTTQGQPLLKFKRLLVGKNATQNLVVRNPGIIPVTIRFDMLPTPAFTFEQRNQSITIGPGQTQSFEVRFNPADSKTFDHVVKMVVASNTFENATIALSGEAYMEEIMFDDLPEGLDNELKFGDVPVDSNKQLSFSLRNLSAEPRRFEWAQHANVKFSPQVGHVHGNSRIDVIATLSSAAPADLKAVPIACVTKKIRYTGEVTQWDDRMKGVRFVADDSPATGPDGRLAASATAAITATPRTRRVTEIQPEPAHEVIAGADKSISILCSGVVDVPKLEVALQEILFKPTLMFQTRGYTFPLKNTGKVAVPFEWSITRSGDEQPFSVAPSGGSVPAGGSVDITVKFSPMEADNFDSLLACSIPAGPAGLTLPKLALRGSSERPWCHFELEDSDYLSGGRREADLPGPHGRSGGLDVETRVIEFESIGVRIKNTMRFFVVNPTSIQYEYNWECEDDPGSLQPFRCVNRKGIVSAGKKAEMVFEYTPEKTTLQESFWRFRIPSQKIEVPFLLVGKASEPRVDLDRARVAFRPLLLKSKATEMFFLTNAEHIPFAFQFDAASFASEGQPALTVSPMSGTVPSNGKIAIQLEFAPRVEKEYNFNVVCNIKKKPSKLMLNVKGEGFRVKDSLELAGSDGAVALASDMTNFVDFGSMHINDTRVKEIAVINDGRFPFDFNWTIPSHPHLSMSPLRGTVAPRDKMMVQMTFHPTTEAQLSNMKAVCKVTNGKQYVLQFTGGGAKPMINFSFYNFDFGPRFITSQGFPAATQMLHVTNSDRHDITLDMLYETTPHLDVSHPPSVIPPGETVAMTLTFAPRDVTMYKENIAFEINGLYTVNVIISGEGAPMRLELLKPEQQQLNFGALRVGQDQLRTVKVVNRSKLATTFAASPATVSALEAVSVHVSPTHEIMLRPRESASIELRFAPSARIGAFERKLDIDILGVTRTLLVASGTCQGLELRLDSDAISFASVVRNSAVIKKLRLSNMGEIGSKFRWPLSLFAPDFSISPAEGYVAPNEDVTFEVSFRPTEVNPDISIGPIPCSVDGSAPLLLTLSGACVAPPTDAKTLTFKTKVRQTAKETVTIPNKFDTAWKLKPSLDHEYWSGPDVVPVAAGASATYTIVYSPLTMTKAGEPHKCTAFFPLPDGTAVMYTLVGTADAPDSAGAVSKEFPAKTQGTIPLQVKNWLRKPQRFKVDIAIEKPDPSTTLKGLDFFDVPASLEREYRLSFFAFKEGVTNAKVTFIAEGSSEYVVYNVSVKATAPAVIGTVSLDTPVRQKAVQQVTVTNPLDTDVALACSADKPEVSVPVKVTVPARGEAKVDVSYMPTVPGAGSGKLKLVSTELGTFMYDLQLKALAPLAEKVLQFKASLGTTHVQTYRFTHYSKQKVDFACAVTQGTFAVDPKLSANPATSDAGIEVEVTITYEPYEMGESKDTLKITSPAAGEYIIPLHGVCVQPKPQGPFVVKSGGSIQIPFKNVFNAQKEYKITVDNANFVVKDKESAAPKKPIPIAVTFKPTPEAAAAKTEVTGKLTVTSGDLPPWVFYLKGSFA
eukprot:TRINITY_DN7486_c0_g1_i1.p1 TRINITY_DN7486_c0_g1~~TRINITY_DN7486_c0_g1_i1.p1  ORF type:complete len:4186 (-),score=1237.39 TRINITY_DN7486_c0_g1_i1:99-12656(-)